MNQEASGQIRLHSVGETGKKNTKPFYLKYLKTGTIFKENGQFVHIVVYTATKCPFAFAKANLHEKLYLCIPYRRHSECVELGIFHHLLFTFANLRCDIKILCTTLQVDSMNPNECFNCPLN